MSKERHFHRVPKVTRDVLKFIQHRADKPVVGGFHPDANPYSAGQDTEIRQFPQSGLVFKEELRGDN